MVFSPTSDMRRSMTVLPKNYIAGFTGVHDPSTFVKIKKNVESQACYLVIGLDLCNYASGFLRNIFSRVKREVSFNTATHPTPLDAVRYNVQNR